MTLLYDFKLKSTKAGQSFTESAINNTKPVKWDKQ